MGLGGLELEPLTALVIMVEPMYRTHRCPRNPVLGLGLSSDGGVRSRFHASTIVPGSMILTDAVEGTYSPPAWPFFSGRQPPSCGAGLEVHGWPIRGINGEPWKLLRYGGPSPRGWPRISARAAPAFGLLAL